MFGEIKSGIAAFVQDEEGASMVEYILVLVAIALAAMGAFKLLGGKVTNQTGNAANQIS